MLPALIIGGVALTQWNKSPYMVLMLLILAYIVYDIFSG
jgi:hypothetical protein